MLPSRDSSSTLTDNSSSCIESPRETSLSIQFAKSLSLQSLPITTINATFVHKLYNMVVDHQYQHLIAWNYIGASFIVCNVLEFSKDVLPKHFKHSNFSSFVRQLNMYGFHKINKSPRILAENQIWEFSHSKFIRDRIDLLDEIKRKTYHITEQQQSIESYYNVIKGVNNNNQQQLLLNMTSKQSEIVHELIKLKEGITHVMTELTETRKKQEEQQQLLNNMMQFLMQQNSNTNSRTSATTTTTTTATATPSIFVTSHHDTTYKRQQLTIQTQNVYDQFYSPSLSAYHTAINSPASPFFLSTDNNLQFNNNSTFTTTSSTL